MFTHKVPRSISFVSCSDNSAFHSTRSNLQFTIYREHSALELCCKLLCNRFPIVSAVCSLFFWNKKVPIC